MISVIPVILMLLTPVTAPVSGGKLTEFRFMHGLVPLHYWTEITGFPFYSEKTFSEITFAGGSRKAFRILSSGATAGLHASIGSMVTEEGYAGFLTVRGLSVSVCDFTGYSIASNWRGITLDYRETEGLQGEYRRESVLLAGGPEAFTAGVSTRLNEYLRIGPAWCQDSQGGRFGVQGDFYMGCLNMASGGAVLDSIAVFRTSAVIRKENLTASAGYDGIDYFGTAGLEPLFLLQFPDWGVSSQVAPARSTVLCFSHSQGGKFMGEVQLSIHGITGGIVINRFDGGDYAGGFIFGVSL